MAAPATEAGKGKGNASGSRRQSRDGEFQAQPPKPMPALGLRPSMQNQFDSLMKQQRENQQDPLGKPEKTTTPHNSVRRSSTHTGRSRDGSREAASETLRKAASETSKPRRERVTSSDERGKVHKRHSTRRREKEKEKEAEKEVREKSTPRQSKERARSVSPTGKEKGENEQPEKVRTHSAPTPELRRSRSANHAKAKKRVKTSQEAGTGATLPSQNLKVNGIEELDAILKRVFGEDEQARDSVRSIMKQVHEIQPADNSDSEKKKFNRKVLKLLTDLGTKDRKALLQFTRTMEESEEEGPDSTWISYGKGLAHYTELLKQVEQKLNNSPVAETVFGFVQTNTQLDFNT